VLHADAQVSPFGFGAAQSPPFVGCARAPVPALKSVLLLLGVCAGSGIRCAVFLRFSSRCCRYADAIPLYDRAVNIKQTVLGAKASWQLAYSLFVAALFGHCPLHASMLTSGAHPDCDREVHIFALALFSLLQASTTSAWRSC
jgi:hypothetical protein